MLWGLARLSPLQVGFLLLEWGEEGAQMCRDVCGTALVSFPSQAWLEETLAPAQAPLTCLVSAAAAAAAQAAPSSPVLTALGALCRCSDDVRAWAAGCRGWAEASKGTPLQ